MLKSMTGFGRCENVTDEYKLSVEMKAVNHRYLDLNIKMPKRFNYFETSIRTLLKKYIQRGKVDLFINYEDYTESSLCLKYNQALAAEYMGYFERMAEEFNIQNDVKVSALAKFPEVLTMEQTPDDEEHLWEILSCALEEAAVKLVESRELEGENLKKDLLGKLDYMTELVDFVEARSPQILAEYRARLEDKVKELLEGTAIDESRIAAEVTLYADKVCVDEETVRLKSHIENTRRELMSGECVGRKLDFIAQEMNREANTILSKASDLSVSHKAIALKTEIEKVREQIQNIE
ncbi:MAG: YicC/YloC family endoribonuclease [Clostridiaceae bacterium]|uniref:YicC/YloC family endoribonuclease n=1 Tax=Clostridium sp. TaxID=1506 RepID=UPI00258FC8D6|nr:YicC/YloC family endoribonuclease [Clostridium sp.]MCI6139338.1 YicC family protein [Clostridium sp.]MDY3232550.1 YicC/YloC family endoribonuclease [Clostridiaceae bacterium]